MPARFLTRREKSVTGGLLRGRSLAQWLAFEGTAGRPAAADEPLRLDPFLAQWLLGDPSALANEPRIRRALRLVPWPGAGLLQAGDGWLENCASQWLVLGGGDPAAWRARIEASAHQLIRVELSRLSGLDLLEIELRRQAGLERTRWPIS